MANTLGNPTSVSAKAREGQVSSLNTTLTSSPTLSNPLLRIREGSTVLVEFPLHATTPLTMGSEDGSGAFAFADDSVAASGGASSIPNNYQVIGRDNVVHLAGDVTGSEAISAGQIVDAATITVTAPAS